MLNDSPSLHMPIHSSKISIASGLLKSKKTAQHITCSIFSNCSIVTPDLFRAISLTQYFNLCPSFVKAHTPCSSANLQNGPMSPTFVIVLSHQPIRLYPASYASHIKYNLKP